MKKAPYPGGGKQGRYYDELPHADEAEPPSRSNETPPDVWFANVMVVILIVIVVAALGLRL